MLSRYKKKFRNVIPLQSSRILNMMKDTLIIDSWQDCRTWETYLQSVKLSSRYRSGDERVKVEENRNVELEVMKNSSEMKMNQRVFRRARSRSLTMFPDDVEGFHYMLELTTLLIFSSTFTNSLLVKNKYQRKRVSTQRTNIYPQYSFEIFKFFLQTLNFDLH